MNTKQAYEEQVKSRLSELDKQIANLAEQVDKQAGEARQQAQKQLDSLKAQREEIAQRAKAVQDASGAAWEDLRGGLNDAIEALSQSVDKAFGRFEKAS